MSDLEFNKSSKSYIIKLFLTILFIFIVLFYMLGLISNYRTLSSEVNTTSTKEQLVVDGATERLTDHLDFITSDLLYLKYQAEVTLAEGHTFEELAYDWLVYAEESRIYNQIRFLDTDGMEITRINHTDDNGFYIVDQNDLQDKSNRYYFINTIGLSDDSVYYSNVDLNEENGAFTTPYELTFRLSTPLYFNNILQGIIILNFDVDFTLDKMPYYDQSSDGDVYLLDENGYFIYHNDDHYLWGFDLSDRADYNFNTMFEDAWDKIEKDRGQFINKDGLFTVDHIDLRTVYDNDQGISFYADKPDIYIVSFVSNDVNPYLISENLFFNLLFITTLNNWPILISLILVSIIITLLVYIRLKINYETRHFASTDQLTGIYNRKYGIDALEKSVSQNKNLTICFIDLNGLKQVNDIFGHQIGDEFITQIVNIIKSQVKFPDYVFRLGGDEFLIVSHLNKKQVEAIWTNIILIFDQINISQVNPYELSASHGVVAYRDDLIDVNHFIAEADQLMYKEKSIYYKQKGQS